MPPPDDLRHFRSDSIRADALDSAPEMSASPSSRPTLAPEDPTSLLDAFAEAEIETLHGRVSSPSAELGSSPASSAETSLAPEPGIELGPVVSLEPDPTPPAVSFSPRRFFARFLFALLFTGVTGLLGYAFKPQLAEASRDFQRLVAPAR